MKITKDIIELTYSKGLLVTKNKSTVTVDDAIARTGMDTNSAKTYNNCVIALLSNGSFGRTVNGQAAEYFLSKILKDFGKTGLSRALEVMKQHTKSNKNPQKNILAIIRKYERLLSNQVK